MTAVTGPVLVVAVAVAAHDVAVLGQFLLDCGVGGFAVALDVDQQLQAAVPLRVDAVALAADQVLERIEVEALERHAGLGILQVVGNQQLAVHQPHVRFHAGEAMLQRIEQGTVMLIVVVRMRLGERLADDDGSRLGCLRRGRGCCCPGQGGKDGDGGKGAFHEHGVLLKGRGFSARHMGTCRAKGGVKRLLVAGERRRAWWWLAVNWEGPLAWRFHTSDRR